jgi:hypothetical protein
VKGEKGAGAGGWGRCGGSKGKCNEGCDGVLTEGPGIGETGLSRSVDDARVSLTHTRASLLRIFTVIELLRFLADAQRS